jgi:hypothetical protein
MDTVMDTPRRPRAFRPELADELGTGTERPGWDLGTERRIDDGRTMARGLALFSLGLGALELLAPERVGRWLGMEDRAGLIRAYGVREIVKGLGILSNRNPSEWVWGRVAGDFLDLATLASGLTPDNPKRANVGLAIGSVVGVTVLDVVCARQLSANERRRTRHDA